MPHRLHRIDAKIPDVCWRGCRQKGSYLHCIWDCPRLQPFWKEIQNQIHHIMDFSLPFCPGLIILNFWHVQPPDPLRKELLELLLCAARNLSTLHWKSTKTQMVQEWYLKVWYYFLQDKVSVSIVYIENIPVPSHFQDKFLQPLPHAIKTPCFLQQTNIMISFIFDLTLSCTLYTLHFNYDLVSCVFLCYLYLNLGFVVCFMGFLSFLLCYDLGGLCCGIWNEVRWLWC